MERIILGLDPGLRVTGYSILKNGSTGPQTLDLGYLQLANIKDIAERLLEFENFLVAKLEAYKVTDLCIETPFFGKNAQTFLKLGFLRGITLLTVKKHAITLHEFAPTSVKLAVTGFGGADKLQVARAVGMLFPQIQKLPKTVLADVTDAIAVSICGIFSLDQKPALNKPALAPR